ncbi:outer membrane protein assembly factor BamB [Ramlibacter solisilvae]|uniref:Outer membrane protein assembly factor BamB n=1 Tax=Ramlibacter tataouinensis TaxID=94132 RepID=A0A127JYD3_9BURK|nr:outer membrane protein assembly factor BamB [Ramlibacter tataouinensis]AMO24904.1 membrane protein [Ramlibacter tataouinensis]
MRRASIVTGGRRLCIALGVATLTACSSLPLPSFLSSSEKPKPAELTPNPATLGMRSAWTARIGAVDMPLTVNANGSSFVVAGSDGSVAAFDAASGRELWRASAGGPIAAGVGSDGKVSAVVTRANDLVAFEEGKEIWRQRLAAGAYTAPFVAGARVFVLTADRAVSAFDGKTGRKLWSQSRPGEPLVLRQPGVMLAVGDTLVVGLSGRLAGLNPQNGLGRWEAPIATPRGINDVERLVDLVGRVSRTGDVVCARAFQTSVGCVDTRRGAVVWSKQANGAEGVDGDGTLLFGSEADGKVVAWKRDSGERAWTSEMLLHRGLTAPLSLGRSVVVGDSFGYVHILSREDGKLLNRVATDSSAVAAAPVLAGNTLVVVTRSGGVYGFVPQ